MFARLTRLFSILTLVIAAAAVPRDASAQHYFARGSAQIAPAPGGVKFVGSGNATHLGRYTEVGRVYFTPLHDEVVAVDGWVVYTAANGDRLCACVAGTLDFATGAIEATLTYHGGCGRFENATGTSILIGQLTGGTIEVTVVGNIEY